MQNFIIYLVIWHAMKCFNNNEAIFEQKPIEILLNFTLENFIECVWHFSTTFKQTLMETNRFLCSLSTFGKHFPNFSLLHGKFLIFNFQYKGKPDHESSLGVIWINILIWEKLFLFFNVSLWKPNCYNFSTFFYLLFKAVFPLTSY